MPIQFSLPAGDPDWHTTILEVLLRIGMAAGLGAVVALLYRASRDAAARSRGFAQTLVLLSPLIAMVTIAVGQNVAAAFTLVGTLAIVRFRTVIQDSRDMAFVIFSVAVGMALGTYDLVVAACGVVTIGAVILLLRRIERGHPTETTATLRLVLSPPESDPSLYADVIERFGGSYAIRRSTIDRARARLDVRLRVSGIGTTRSPALLTELLQTPEIVRATYEANEND